MEVSIIIPNYNNAMHINSCIDSCLNQMNSSFEIIIVDDHSTDKSWQIISEYKNKHPEIIKVFKNPKKGACSARNFGFMKSHGKFIQFLDSDDQISLNKLTTQYESIKNLREEVVANCGWLHFINSPNSESIIRQPIDKNYNNPIDWLLDSWNGGGMGQTGCWLIPRKIIKKSGLWDESLLINQDGEFITRVLCNSKGIIFCENILAHYRKPSISNVSSRKNRSSAISLLHSYKLYEKVLSFNNNAETRSALAQNYSKFIYNQYNKNRDLSKKAIQYCHKLKQPVQINFSDPIALLLSNLFGYRFSLFIRYLIKGY